MPTADFFNQGIVTQDLSGTLYVVFEHEGLDIKGLTIDFGECYPVDFYSHKRSWDACVHWK